MSSVIDFRQAAYVAEMEEWLARLSRERLCVCCDQPVLGVEWYESTLGGRPVVTHVHCHEFDLLPLTPEQADEMRIEMGAFENRWGREALDLVIMRLDAAMTPETLIPALRRDAALRAETRR